MKKIILVTFSGILISSCASKWECKIVSIEGKEDKTMADFQTNNFDFSSQSLNLLGKDGWELVGMFEKTETVHPNFGNAEYVSGIQPNVRTAEVNFVFKRRK